MPRFHYGLQAGATWPAFTSGALSGPPPVTALLVLTTIMASGAAFGTQVSLALVWVVGMFAVVEIILVCHLAAPAKTQAALQRLHDWILAHRRQVLIALIAVAGVAMLALGTRGIRAGGYGLAVADQPTRLGGRNLPHDRRRPQRFRRV